MTIAAEHLIRSYKCPDCGAPADLIRRGPVSEVEVRHEPTCPYYAAMIRRTVGER